jgi:hypothetical protein
MVADHLRMVDTRSGIAAGVVWRRFTLVRMLACVCVCTKTHHCNMPQFVLSNGQHCVRLDLVRVRFMELCRVRSCRCVLVRTTQAAAGVSGGYQRAYG